MVPLTSAVAVWAEREETDRRSTITRDMAVAYEERITILLEFRTGDLTVGRFIRLRVLISQKREHPSRRRWKGRIALLL
jgi:hypothetical protein